jgi:tripartite-type tricarboxylate transporter receptor subunit TctC
MSKLGRVTAAIVAAALIPMAASAQQYPTRAIRMVIGFPPGGGTDIVGRIVAQKLSESLGQQVLPDNRGGASGQIGTEIVAKAAPDGYTLLMAHIAALSILPSLVPKLPYDPAKDFAPISLAAIAPNLLVVHPSLPVRNVKELVALARARPGELQFSSVGSGSIQHIAGEMFKLQANVSMLHVPYKGSGQSIIDLVSGQIHMDFGAIPPVLSHVKSGRLRAIAVTSEKRFSLLPEIPTISEGGVPGFDMSTWWGLVAPAGVAKEVVARLHTETARILRQPDVREKLANVGADPGGNSPEEFAGFIRAERTKYARVVKDAQIKLD